jgi:hypothetical protein
MGDARCERGGIDIGKVKHDKSADAALQQVSLPIIDADGKVIGALTFGILVDELQMQRKLRRRDIRPGGGCGPSGAA